MVLPSTWAVMVKLPHSVDLKRRAKLISVPAVVRTRSRPSTWVADLASAKVDSTEPERVTVAMK